MTRDQLLQHITGILSDTFGIDAARVNLDARLSEDLDIDSIDAVDLIVQLKPLIGNTLKPEAFKSVRTVSDVVEAVYAMLPACAEEKTGA